MPDKLSVALALPETPDIRPLDLLEELVKLKHCWYQIEQSLNE